MKYLFTLIIIPILFFNTKTQQQNVAGKWIGEDQNEIGYIFFNTDGYAAFEIEGKTMGGEEFVMNGQKGKMTYTINYKTTPIEVDFTMTKLDSGESKNILGIIEFLDKDTMNFDMSFDSKRPTEFGERSIILRRVK
ncbi:hypothetical protein [Winogradskyella vidalii]|uniref:hypothetical protein n=1 Tax=Winogradskyella vidalii TaxID=2615024 RepID=UPI0015CB9F36|nr:hypothetical protein [Winogradskyella vidalii]